MTSPEAVSAESAAHVPVHLTRFVGRDRELEELARRCGESFERVGWVDLTPIGDASLVAQLIATSLHVPSRAGTTPLQALVGSLCDARALVVIDNCEHLVDASAE